MTLTATTTMVDIEVPPSTRCKVLFRQRPLQLLLITERPNEEKEFHIDPQWED
uniref:Zinc-binding protein n=1 Tax=Solanum tuberosum TaxID=4113 RepID=M1BII7_SOLTU